MTLVIGIDTGTHVRNFNRIDHSIDNASILGFQSSSLKQARPCVGSFKRGGHINLEIWSRCIGDFKRHSRLSSPVAFTHISTSRADNTVHLVLQFHAIPGEVLETSIATISSGRVVDAIDDVPLHTDMIFRRQPSPVIIAKTTAKNFFITFPPCTSSTSFLVTTDLHQLGKLKLTPIKII